jgi:excisionase family DNA binding protein
MDEKQGTTISVPEMGRMLGLKKTDAYWLVHKQCFETVTVGGKIRVVLESFEHWYANQIKHKKVDGTPPGQELRANSYSVKEMAEELNVAEGVAYDIIKRYGIETFEVDSWKRVRKDVFDAWYKTQSRYRTQEDREKDAELEASSMSMPEMARLLLISRQEAYNILLTGKDRAKFEFVYICGRRRVTKKSFENWYVGQTKYRKLCDRSPEEIAGIEKEHKEAEHPRLKVDENKAAFNLQEASVLLDLTYNEVRSLIKSGDLGAKKYGTRYLIPRDEIQWFILQQRLEREM